MEQEWVEVKPLPAGTYEAVCVRAVYEAGSVAWELIVQDRKIKRITPTTGAGVVFYQEMIDALGLEGFGPDEVLELNMPCYVVLEPKGLVKRCFYPGWL